MVKGIQGDGTNRSNQGSSKWHEECQEPYHASGQNISLKETKKLQNHGIEEENTTGVARLSYTESPTKECQEPYHASGQNISLKATKKLQNHGIEEENTTGVARLSYTESPTKVRIASCDDGRPMACDSTDLQYVTFKENQHFKLSSNQMPLMYAGKPAHGVKKLLLQEIYMICNLLFNWSVTAISRAGKASGTRKVWSVLLFGLLLLQVTADPRGDVCSDMSVATMRMVQECPMDNKTWDERAELMNCSAQCSYLQYHCVRNGFENATVEVCANATYIQPGFCPEFNILGKRIQNSHVKRPTYPGKVFISTDVYQYPVCLRLEPSPGTPNRPTTILSISTPPTSSPIKNESYVADDQDQNGDEVIYYGSWIIPVSAGVLAPFSIVVILIIIFRCIRSQENTGRAGALSGAERGMSNQGDDHAEMMPLNDIVWKYEVMLKRMGADNMLKRMGANIMLNRMGSDIMFKRMGADIMLKRMGADIMLKRMGADIMKRMNF